jgi:hypothetical protein
MQFAAEVFLPRSPWMDSDSTQFKTTLLKRIRLSRLSLDLKRSVETWSDDQWRAVESGYSKVRNQRKQCVVRSCESRSSYILVLFGLFSRVETDVKEIVRI